VPSILEVLSSILSTEKKIKLNENINKPKIYQGEKKEKNQLLKSGMKKETALLT
jgi:hypothetical protein